MQCCAVAYSIYEYDGRVKRETEALLSDGHEVDVICLGEKYKQGQAVVDGARLHRVQSRDVNEKYLLQYVYRLMKFFILTFFKLTWLFFKKRYRIIHVHNLPDFLVFTTVIPKLFGAKVILDIHDVLPEFYARKFNATMNHACVRLLKILERISTGYANHVITVTEIWRERLCERGVPSGKCSVILNAPDERLFPGNFPAIRNNGAPTKLIYTGTLKEHSGIDVILEAVRKVKMTGANLCLDVYGMGEEKANLLNQAESLQLQDLVEFHEAVPIAQMSEVLAGSDIGIDPKKDGVYSGETLSVKSMEFLATGLPAIVSKTKAAAAYYDDSMVSFFEPGDADDLGKLIIELSRNPERRQVQRTNGRKFFERHSWKNYRQKYLEIVHSLSPEQY